MARMLELNGVSKAFGGLNVISGLDFHVDEHEIVSVIGPNGAGKTTLFNIVTGVYQPDKGEVLFEGESIVGLPPQDHAAWDGPHVPDPAALPQHDRCKENVMAAEYGRTRAGSSSRCSLRVASREERAISAREEKLAFFGQRLMGYRWDHPAYSLPTPTGAGSRSRGRRRRTATAPPRRARRRHEPGRDPRDHRADRQAPRRRRPTRSSSSSTTCTWSRASRTASSRSTTASRSRRGPSTRWRRTRLVIEAYLGRRAAAVEAVVSATRTGAEAASARARSVDTYYGLIHILDVSPQVYPGELVCLLGGNASGKSTTLKTCLGIVRPRAGRVEFEREDITTKKTSLRIERGMAIVPENRRLFAPDERAREPPDGRVSAWQGREGGLDRVTASFRCSTSGERSSPGRSPVASSRWSRWPGR